MKQVLLAKQAVAWPHPNRYIAVALHYVWPHPSLRWPIATLRLFIQLTNTWSLRIGWSKGGRCQIFYSVSATQSSVNPKSFQTNIFLQIYFIFTNVFHNFFHCYQKIFQIIINHILELVFRTDIICWQYYYTLFPLNKLNRCIFMFWSRFILMKQKNWCLFACIRVNKQ